MKLKDRIFSFFCRIYTGTLFPNSALEKEENVVLHTEEGTLIFRRLKVIKDVLVEDAIKDIEKAYGQILYIASYTCIEDKLSTFLDSRSIGYGFFISTQLSNGIYLKTKPSNGVEGIGYHRGTSDYLAVSPYTETADIVLKAGGTLFILKKQIKKPLK